MPPSKLFSDVHHHEDESVDVNAVLEGLLAKFIWILCGFIFTWMLNFIKKRGFVPRFLLFVAQNMAQEAQPNPLPPKPTFRRPPPSTIDPQNVPYY